MEIIIVLAVCGFALYWFFVRKSPVAKVETAPYKVEATPAPAAEPDAVVVVENAVVPEAVVAAPAKKPRKPRAPKAPAAKAPAAKTPAAKKPAVKKPAARTVRSKKV
jgi:hypothetical protein